MNISVCSPSYKRPRVKTLDYLPFCRVYVDHKEYEDYVKSNPEGSEIISCPEGVQGNVSRIRNYILEQEFARGMDAVCIMDDDMKGLYTYDVDRNTGYGYVSRKIKEDTFIEFLERYTEICRDLGFKLWGVNLNSDPMAYRHYSPFSFSSVILGPFSVHLQNDIRYDEKLPLKEDYDLALQHLNKYRGILKLNFAHYLCEQSTNVGGCATYRNLQRKKEQFELLQRKWGKEIVREDKSNKGKTKKEKRFDYNPIIKIPIKGI